MGGKWRDRVVIALDGFAQELLEQVKTGIPATNDCPAIPPGGIDQRAAVFEKVTRWIAIKNKLGDSEDEDGSGIAELKSRIKGPAPEPEKRGRGRPPKHKPPGSALATLKRALPAADGGSADGSGRDVGRAVPAAAGGNGSFRVVLSGDGESDDDESDRVGDL